MSDPMSALVVNLPLRLRELQKAFEVYEEPSAAGRSNTAAREKQPVYEALFDDIITHEDVWFELLLDVNREESPCFTAAERAFVIMMVLCTQQRMWGPEVHKAVQTLALAERLLKRLEELTSRYGDAHRKDETGRLGYHYHSNGVNIFSSRLEEKETVRSFRWAADYEIRENQKLDVCLAVPGLKTRARLNKLKDADIWEAVVEYNKKTMGTKRKCCNHCDKAEVNSGDHSVCSRCKNACYCSKECQRLHWKAQHKKECLA
jgi:hypothetical protein